MRRSIVVLTLWLLPAASHAAEVRTTADDTGRLLVIPHQPLDINCSLGDAPGAITVSWYKSVEGGERVKLKSTGRVKTAGEWLKIQEPSLADDPANYTCTFAVRGAQGDLEATVQVIANVTVKMPGISVKRKEGEDLAIDCTVHGRPWPTVHWTKDSQPISAALQNSSSRLTLRADSRGFPNTRLALTGLRHPADAGDYCCVAENAANVARGCIVVRVKHRYAAVWPVLGILAQLLLLAALIAGCEARRGGGPGTEDTEPDTDARPPPREPTAGDVRQRK